MKSFQLVKVPEAVKPLGLDNANQLYRVIRENQFPFPQAIVRFGKQIRINLTAVEKAMEPEITEKATA